MFQTQTMEIENYHGLKMNFITLKSQGENDIIFFLELNLI